jgi:hypothetical protein
MNHRLYRRTSLMSVESAGLPSESSGALSNSSGQGERMVKL